MIEAFAHAAHLAACAGRCGVPAAASSSRPALSAAASSEESRLGEAHPLARRAEQLEPGAVGRVCQPRRARQLVHGERARRRQALLRGQACRDELEQQARLLRPPARSSASSLA